MIYLNSSNVFVPRFHDQPVASTSCRHELEARLSLAVTGGGPLRLEVVE